MEWSLTQNKLLAYHRLMRTDKPIGALLLLWPTLWALWVATPGVPPLWILGVFVAGVWLMRAAGCVVNDYADRKFDGHVKRTANRPLPSGQVTGKEARVAVPRTGAALIPAGVNAEHHDNSAFRRCARAGLGLSVHEALYPSASGCVGRGIWLVDSDGVCGGE